MPRVHFKPFKLTARHKAFILAHLKGELSGEQCAVMMGVSRQRLYTMLTAMFRRACSDQTINIEEVIKTF